MKSISKILTWLVVIGAVVFIYTQYKKSQPGIEAGDMMPSISFTTLDGMYYDNSNFKGQYILIDFWGSWCIPCRAANAELKSLYKEVQKTDKFAEKFSLISIGYERDSTQWLKAIEDQRLTWPLHAMEDQKGDTPLTRAFKIVAFPTNILINPDGRIVGVNVSQTEVISRLRKL